MLRHLKTYSLRDIDSQVITGNEENLSKSGEVEIVYAVLKYAVFSLICAPYYNFPAFMRNLGTATMIFIFKSCS